MNRRALVRLAAVTIVAAFGLATGGCGGGRKDFSPDEFATVRQDMPEAEVVAVLGTPADAMEGLGVRRLFWESQGKYYSVSFKDGKVVAPLVHGDEKDYQMMKGLMHVAKGMDKK